MPEGIFQENPETIAILGAGAWGLALAASAARTGKRVLVVSRKSLSAALPHGITQAKDMREAAAQAQLVVFAVPSSVATEVARDLGDWVDGSHYIVHGVRGLVGNEMQTISDILRKQTPVRRVGALGGPALAEDLLTGRPSILVSGSYFPEVNEAVLDAFAGPALRIYVSDDLRGLEWASALVGCLAIAVGYAQKSQMSAGLVAGLISRALDEAGRIAVAAGGKEKTLLGLAGYGDLLASIAQSQRPEVLLGHALASGKPREQALREIGQNVEAALLVPRVVAFSKSHGVDAPIFDALGHGILEGHRIDDLVNGLMALPVNG